MSSKSAVLPSICVRLCRPSWLCRPCRPRLCRPCRPVCRVVQGCVIHLGCVVRVFQGCVVRVVQGCVVHLCCVVRVVQGCAGVESCVVDVVQLAVSSILVRLCNLLRARRATLDTGSFQHRAKNQMNFIFSFKFNMTCASVTASGREGSLGRCDQHYAGLQTDSRNGQLYKCPGTLSEHFGQLPRRNVFVICLRSNRLQCRISPKENLHKAQPTVFK